MQPSQTFHDHVKELRNRLLWVLLTVTVGASVGYIFRNALVRFIQKPLASPLYYNTPAGSFNFIMKISMMIGLFVAIPVILYHVIRYIEPALPKRFRKRAIINTLTASSLLAIVGAAFGYYVILPMSLHFFSGYSSGTIKPLISAGEYLNYVVNMLITFVLLFQIPLIVLFINHIKPLKPKRLLKYQKWVVVGAFAIAVVLPFTYAPITQFLMAAPIIFLYYLSVVLLAIVNKRAVRREAKLHKSIVQTENSTNVQAPVVTESIPQASIIKDHRQSVPLTQAVPQATKTMYLDGITTSQASSTNLDPANRPPRRPIVQPLISNRKNRFVDGFKPVTNQSYTATA